MSGRERTTIHDVAEAAGVSHQTVSNVLNNSGRVGPSTRARVTAAIDELGYRPRSDAVSLRTRRSGRLAHPIAVGELSPANTIMVEFIHELTSAASRHNQHLVLAAEPTGGDAGELEDVERLVRSGTVDAVLLANVVVGDARVALLARRGIPFACFGRTDPAMPQNWIDVNDRAGVHTVTSHLIAAGHVDVAFLGYDPQGGWDLEREAGYRDATAAAGLCPRAVTVAPRAASVRDAISGLLTARVPPTAIVTGSDVLAGAVYSAAAHRGLRIGSDLAVTGYDGSMAGRLLTPALTTLAIPVDRICEWLVVRALAEVEGPTGAPGELVDPELVLGASG